MKRKNMILGLAIATLGLVAAPAMAGEDCEGDANGDGAVTFLDIVAVATAFSGCDDPCPEDVNGDGMITFDDLLLVISNFGCGLESCETPADCDDMDPCTVDVCIAGTCHNIPLPDCDG